MSHRCRDAALEYADRGWLVLALDGKKPNGRLVPNGFKDATSDPHQIREWWRARPDANVGIVCGSASGIVVIDQDGLSGADELRHLQQRFGDLPETLTASSRGTRDRRHFYYRLPSGLVVKRRTKINAADLDVLGDGGYVVAPPSVHPTTGKRYRWLNRRKPALLPAWVADLAPNGTKPKHRGSAPTLPDIIYEGERDVLLTSLAGSARKRGASEDGILALLREENARRCRPPLSDEDLIKIAHSIARYDPLPIALNEPINDINLAARFAKLESEQLRYCPPWHSWLLWDGARWAQDVTFEADRRTEQMVRGLLDLVASVPDDRRDEFYKSIRHYTRHRKLKDVVDRARTQERLIVTPDRLDTDAWSLNVVNGTIDLRTGALRPHDPAEGITKLAPVAFDPDATAPRWDAFLRDAMNGDDDLLGFLQRAVGYTLIGEVREHVLFFLHGDRATGKSTFLETLQALFGDYGVMIEFETLLQGTRSGEAHRDIVRLHHARLVMANETPTNARFNEAVVKHLTGDDTVRGRLLYREAHQFRPSHTIWLRANDKPSVHDPSDAFWERIKLVPFTRRVSERDQDRELKHRFRAEMSGVLNWALAGALAYQRDGLSAPKSVRRATRLYREEQDAVGAFITDRCVLDQSAWTATAELYRAFTDWWRDTRGPRLPVMNATAFGNALDKRGGLYPKKHRGVRGWYGIALRYEVDA